MNYEVQFYEMITKADDEIIRLSEEINNLRKHLIQIQDDKSYSDNDREDVRRQMSEMYLTSAYATVLRDNISELFPQIRLFDAFVNHRFEYETFNLLYEESEIE